MATLVANKFRNGNEMLIYMGDQAIGHCTSCSITLSTETKDRAFKPVASASASRGLYKNKGITGLSASVKADGLDFIGETEAGYKAIVEAWDNAQSVALSFKERGSEDAILSGKFVITSLDRTDPSNDDSTYSVSFDNDGEVTVDPSKISNTRLSQPAGD